VVNFNSIDTTTVVSESEYQSIISQYISYFNDLPDIGKKRFLERTAHFRSIKHFSYLGMEEKREVPILISAAAVQITLGLEKYELPFFKNIYITPDAYQRPGEKEVFVGHVSPEGIFISWKYFLQGYGDATDNVNVAIHEMAHALEHESFISETDVDNKFKADFAKFSAVSGPVFASAVVTHRSYLRDYAFKNMQEFWAVSVEAFFENPAGLKQSLPQLYGTLCDILNQDPLTKDKILTKKPLY
jgi:MtfA peptidase